MGCCCCSYVYNGLFGLGHIRNDAVRDDEEHKVLRAVLHCSRIPAHTHGWRQQSANSVSWLRTGQIWFAADLFTVVFPDRSLAGCASFCASTTQKKKRKRNNSLSLSPFRQLSLKCLINTPWLMSECKEYEAKTRTHHLVGFAYWYLCGHLFLPGPGFSNAKRPPVLFILKAAD